MKFAEMLWHYRVRVLRLIDGDTLVVDLDQGLRIIRGEQLRLLRADTAEKNDRDPAERLDALKAEMFAVDWVAAHDHLGDGWFYVRTKKGDAFGRWLAELECSEGHNLGSDLLAAGLADLWVKGG